MKLPAWMSRRGKGESESLWYAPRAIADVSVAVERTALEFAKAVYYGDNPPAEREANKVVVMLAMAELQRTMEEGRMLATHAHESGAWRPKFHTDKKCRMDALPKPITGNEGESK